MNKLPPEQIDGKMYQPVGLGHTLTGVPACHYCVFTPAGYECHSASCKPINRLDGLNIYYINIEGE